MTVSGSASQSLGASPCQIVVTYSSRSTRLLITEHWLLITDLVGETGLEPATFAMSTRCSNQLSYPPEQSDIIPRVGGFGNAD